MKHLYLLLLLLFPVFTFSQIVIVNYPTNLTVECDGNGNTSDLNAWLASNGGAVATPECGVITWSNSFTGLTMTCGSSGSATVIFTASDNCGFATTTATFSIEDTTPPTSITNPPNVTVICDGSGNISEYNAWLSSLNIVFEDNCSTNVTVEVNDTFLPGDCNGTSGYTLTYYATDDCGNTGTETATFTILPAMSDCPEGNVYLGSQADIDNFGSTYPNCESIEGFLIIQGNDIVDLTPLSQINSVGSIQIYGTSLETMAGLESLTIGSFGSEDSFIVIDDNPLLQDILFLNNYTVDVPVVFIIRNMPLLTSLDGASSINEFVTIYLKNNDALTNLDGLNQNLNLVVGYQPPSLYISENAILSDISRLNTVQWNDALTAEISDNLQLAVCENSLVCTLIGNDAITIQNNAIGCNSIAQVSDACNIIPSNDDCEGAVVLTFGQSQTFSNTTATASPQEPSCNDENRIDVWFRFNSLNVPAVTITVSGDYNLQLWEGSCAALTLVDNACAAGILSEIPLASNTNYFIQVWSDGTGRFPTGIFDLLVQDASLSVSENAFESFSMFPNPVNSMLTINSTKTIDSLEIYNLLGQQVKMANPNTQHFDIDMSSIKVGMYVLKVRIGNETETFKLLKE